MNPIMSMQVRLGLLETRIKQNDTKSSFQSAFKEEDHIEIQNQRISEAIAVLITESGSDAQVRQLAADWEAVRSKMQNATCGEIRDDLQKVIQDVKDIFKSRTQPVSAQATPQFETFEEPTDEEVVHQIAMEDAKEEALEHHPRTFEVFMETLLYIKDGTFGTPMAQALDAREDALFNMQTLLIFSLWNGDDTVMEETFSSYQAAHSETEEFAQFRERIYYAHPALLGKLLLNPESDLSVDEIALKSQLNAIIAQANMEYPVAQCILEFGGTILNQLDANEIETLPLTREEFEELPKTIVTLEDLQERLDEIMQYPADDRKFEFNELAKAYIEERILPFVNAVFDKMNEAGLANSVYRNCLDILPYGIEITQEAIDQSDFLESIRGKVQHQSDREGLQLSLLFALNNSPQHAPELNGAIDQRIATILNTVPNEQLKKEAVASAAFYYASKRNDVDKAASLIQTHIPGDKEPILEMIQNLSTRGLSVKELVKMGYTISMPQWWTDLSSRFQ